MALFYLTGKSNLIPINNETEKFDTIILAPSLYWVETVTIPTKNIQKAKKIASNMLENRPENFTEISLSLLDKSQMAYKVFAYDKNDIINRLQEHKIYNYRLFLAEQLTFDKCLKLNQITLCKINNRILELPAKNNMQAEVIEYYSELLKNEKPVTQQYQYQKNKKTLLIAALLLLVLYIGIDALYNWQRVTNISKQSTKLLQQTKLPQSSYQREALLKKYTKTQQQIQKVRKKLYKALQEYTNIKKITYSNNSMKVETE